MAKGWILLERSLLDHWIWSQTAFSPAQAWIDLLFMVNHTDKKIMLDGSSYNVKRGSTITSIRKLGDRWRWSRHKVDNFLNSLKLDMMIEKNSDTKKTEITVLNYDKFQNRRTPRGQQRDTNGDSAGTSRDTNKECKRIYKEIKEGGVAAGRPSGEIPDGMAEEDYWAEIEERRR